MRRGTTTVVPRRASLRPIAFYSMGEFYVSNSCSRRSHSPDVGHDNYSVGANVRACANACYARSYSIKNETDARKTPRNARQMER